jgi:hypothetical protein
VQTVTVRRWIDVPPEDVWERLIDLEGLAIRDPQFDVVDLSEGGWLRPGVCAILSRRHGRRRVDLSIDVLDAVAPRELALRVATTHTSWVVRILLEACPAGATDLIVQAALDPAASDHPRLRAVLHAADGGLEADIAALLESIALRATQHQQRRPPERQRIAAGR